METGPALTFWAGQSIGLLKPQFIHLGNGYYSHAFTTGDLGEINETMCAVQQAQILEHSEPSGSATAALAVIYKDHENSQVAPGPPGLMGCSFLQDINL